MITIVLLGTDILARRLCTLLFFKLMISGVLRLGVTASPTLEELPLALWRWLLERFPTVGLVSAYSMKRRIQNLHLVLDHLVDKLVLALCNLNHLLNQTGAKPGLKLGNPVAFSIDHKWGNEHTHASTVYCGSGGSLIGVITLSGV